MTADVTEKKSAPSPFLEANPQAQFAWDSTSLSLFKECPRKYYYAMIEGWRHSKKDGINPHLFFGGEFAHAIENYIQRKTAGMDPYEAMLSVVREALERTWIGRNEDGTGGAGWESTDENKTRINLIRTIVWYIDYWIDDPTEVYILKDGTPAVELSFRFDVGNGILLCGHLDRVVKWKDDIYVMDQKTSKNTITPHYMKQWNPNTQMSLYTLAGKIVFDIPVTGVLIDAVQVAKTFNTFHRGITTRNEAQLDEFLENTLKTIERAHQCAEDNYWPMNETACSNYGGCQFRDVCARSPKIRKALLKSNYDKNFWNPLETR